MYSNNSSYENHTHSNPVSLNTMASLNTLNTVNTPTSASSSQTSLNTNGQIPQLWMGELDQRWDDLTIKQIWTSLLSSMGIVVHSVKLIKDKQSSQLGLANAGYCFIRFHNFEDASKVLNTFNGKPIPGTNNRHYFRLNWSSANIQAAAVAAAATSTLPLAACSNPIEYSIFVGDLPQNINEQILLQTFKSKYPSCTSVKIMVDQTTGNIKGYGFVKFLNEEEQKKALVEMQGCVLLGRAIRVSTASKSNSSLPNASNGNNNTPSGNSSSNFSPRLGSNLTANSNLSNTSLNTNMSPSTLLSSNGSIPTSNTGGLPQQQQQPQQQQPQMLSKFHPHQQQQQQPAQPASNRSLLQPLPQNSSVQYFNDPANTTVFIGGLNVPFTEKQMFDLFSKYGNISYVKIPAGKNCGFVQYFHRASAEMAINEMQGYDIGGGCKIRVSWGARAAQRSWFARQLQLQQQSISQLAQIPASNAASSQHLDQLSNNDINVLLNMSKNQNMAGSLGLFDSYVNVNDTMLNLNGYSVDQYSFQNEQIPYTSMSSNDELKLNKLLLAARDGNLDQLDLGSNMYNS